jgi:hypothetical protein
MTDSPPFERGTGAWEGVVMIIRPDLSKLPYGADPQCMVVSARTVQLGGRRAISQDLPYGLFAHHFTSEDGDHIFAEAEFKDGHLEVYGRARSNIKEWILYSMTDAQSGGGVNDAYL